MDNYKGHAQIVRYLIQNKADISYLSENGKSALNYAYGQENSDIIDILLLKDGGTYEAFEIDTVQVLNQEAMNKILYGLAKDKEKSTKK